MPISGNWFENNEIISQCGNLFFITSKKAAIAYAKDMKTKYPTITFLLSEGTTWGEQKTIGEY